MPAFEPGPDIVFIPFSLQVNIHISWGALEKSKLGMSFSFPMFEPLLMSSVAYSPSNQDGLRRITTSSVLSTLPETPLAGVR